MNPRRLLIVDSPRPQYVVWELTLKCDQRCTHCGSRAAEARPDELSTAEALEVVEQLAGLSAGLPSDVTLIGGEAYLHPGVFEVIRALRRHGIRTTLTTGARGVTAALAHDLAAAGLQAASVSIDGLAETHDLLRATAGSFAAATAALAYFRAAGVLIAANTQVNRLNLGEIEPLYAHLRAQGIRSWQIQQTVPLGRAADRPELILQPYDLLELMPRLARLKEQAWRDGILLMPASPLGYFGPEEGGLRALEQGTPSHFPGCQAGKAGLGIESNGAVKGCPSLQTKHYVGGNVREQSLEALWTTNEVIGFNRRRTVADLWGFCRACPFAEVCMGGCTFTAHAILGRPGNNPMCHFRARTLAREGLRERLVKKTRAPGEPFDDGLFEVVVEPLEAPEPPAAPRGPGLLRVWREPAVA